MNKILATTLLLLAMPASLLAQDAQTGGPSGPAKKAKRPSGYPVVVTMQFDGGTMAEFVAAIRSDEEEANIVLATKARGALVPPMVLKNAGLEQALEGACMAAEADYQVRVKEFRGAGQPVFSITAYQGQKPTRKAQAGRGIDDLTQRVFSLGELTAQRLSGVKSVKVETILSALNMALSDAKVSPRIRYHEDSGLLLVRGSFGQVTVVEQLLSVMGKDLRMREQRHFERRASEPRKANKDS